MGVCVRGGGEGGTSIKQGLAYPFHPFYPFYLSYPSHPFHPFHLSTSRTPTTYTIYSIYIIIESGGNKRLKAVKKLR